MVDCSCVCRSQRLRKMTVQNDKYVCELLCDDQSHWEEDLRKRAAYNQKLHAIRLNLIKRSIEADQGGTGIL